MRYKIDTMKTIIFPTDFSKNAEIALDVAVKIAQKGNMEILMVNAFDLPYATNVMTTSLLDIMRDNSEKGLEQEAKRIAASGVKLRTQSVMGNPIRVVKELSVKYPDSMVILGTKGSSGLEEVLIGSNAVSILQSVDVPVMAVPQFCVYEDVNKIIYATDMQSSKDERALRRLGTLAHLFGAEVMILHVQTDKDAAIDIEGQKAKISQNLGDIKHTFHFTEGEQVEQTIRDFADKNQADLIALLARKYGFFKHLFHSSVTNKVAYHSKRPLVAFHETIA